MKDFLRTRITLVWLLLIAATGISLEATWGIGGDLRILSTAAIVIAFIKVRFVGMEFMELRTAPWPLRFAFKAWVVLVCAGVVILYWVR